MGKIIAFANQKGGVGKTTTCVNVAAYMAMMGKKILILDLDPQGNATSGVGIRKTKDLKTIYDLIDGEGSFDEVIKPTIVDNLYIIPSTVDLAGAEVELIQIPQREKIIKNLLSEIKDILLKRRKSTLLSGGKEMVWTRKSGLCFRNFILSIML